MLSVQMHAFQGKETLTGPAFSPVCKSEDSGATELTLDNGSARKGVIICSQSGNIINFRHCVHRKIINCQETNYQMSRETLYNAVRITSLRKWGMHLKTEIHTYEYQLDRILISSR